jgi:hypothetical protein
MHDFLTPMAGSPLYPTDSGSANRWVKEVAGYLADENYKWKSINKII